MSKLTRRFQPSHSSKSVCWVDCSELSVLPSPPSPRYLPSHALHHFAQLQPRFEPLRNRPFWTRRPAWLLRTFLGDLWRIWATRCQLVRAPASAARTRWVERADLPSQTAPRSSPSLGSHSPWLWSHIRPTQLRETCLGNFWGCPRLPRRWPWYPPQWGWYAAIIVG